MRIGVLFLELGLSDSRSLKHKRQILKSIKDITRAKFNISIAEIGNHDKWQRSTLAIAKLGNADVELHRGLSGILNFLRNKNRIQILDYKIEVF
jgi:hypothetical protein